MALWGQRSGETGSPIKILNNRAWHNLFARQLFIRPAPEELEIHAPSSLYSHVTTSPAAPEEEMGTRTETFIIINFKKKLVLIGSTSYAGEIKKAMFSIMNFILPKKGVFPMHCSANVGKEGILHPSSAYLALARQRSQPIQIAG